MSLKLSDWFFLKVFYFRVSLRIHAEKYTDLLSRSISCDATANVTYQVISRDAKINGVLATYRIFYLSPFILLSRTLVVSVARNILNLQKRTQKFAQWHDRIYVELNYSNRLPNIDEGNYKNDLTPLNRIAVEKTTDKIRLP